MKFKALLTFCNLLSYGTNKNNLQIWQQNLLTILYLKKIII